MKHPTLLSLALLVLAGAVSPPAQAVPEDFRNWTRLGIRGVVPGTNTILPWKLDFQGRFHDNWDRLGQSLLSSGIGYSLGGVLDFSVGFDWMRTTKSGPNAQRDEYRPWQSVGGNITTGGAGFVLRAKLEERIEDGNLTLRFSQLFQAQWPIIFSPPTALFLSNQVFFHLNGNATFAGGFDQNRFMLGFKHPFAGPIQGTIAYLNQALLTEMNHILFLEFHLVLGG